MVTGTMQITLHPEILRRARQRASYLGIPLAEYVRRLLARDLGNPTATANPGLVFDLGSSRGSEIARNKDSMIAEALALPGSGERSH